MVAGDLGVSPGTAITGFPPGVVVGAQHAGDPTAAQGIADLGTAYDDAKGRTLCPITVAGNLGGLTLAPGLYMSTSSLEISSGDLTLDAQGDSNAIFIFQMATTLTTTVGRQVILTNGAAAANIFWQVGSSATLGTSSVFDGTIMADQTITLNTGATLNGRALAHIGAVNLASNSIVGPPCKRRAQVIRLRRRLGNDNCFAAAGILVGWRVSQPSCVLMLQNGVIPSATDLAPLNWGLRPAPPCCR